MFRKKLTMPETTQPNTQSSEVEAIVVEFKTKFVSKNSEDETDYHELFKQGVSATDVEDWLCQALTETANESKREALQEVMNWAMENGITHKESFNGLREFIGSKVNLPTNPETK